MAGDFQDVRGLPSWEEQFEAEFGPRGRILPPPAGSAPRLPRKLGRILGVEIVADGFGKIEDPHQRTLDAFAEATRSNQEARSE